MEENINEVVEEIDDLQNSLEAPTSDGLDIDFSPITEGNDKVVQKLDEVINLLTPEEIEDTGETILPSDYSEQLNNLADLIQQQNDMLITINDANNTILVYGLVIVPLLLVCMCLWWFFKQFLYKF